MSLPTTVETKRNSIAKLQWETHREETQSKTHTQRKRQRKTKRERV
jgi:hypothetical protein